MKTLTKHRNLILQDLKQRNDHPTAKMVFDSVKEKAEKVSFATVYNSLEFLVSEGYINQLNIDSESGHYDACLDKHSHMICKACGKIYDIPQASLATNTDFGNLGFQIEEIEVNIIGRCQNC